MFRGDGAAIEPPRLLSGQVDHRLGAWCQADLARDHRLAAPDNELHRRAHFSRFHAEIGEDTRGDRAFETDQAEQNVLSADEVMVESLPFLLSKRHHPLRVAGECRDVRTRKSGTLPCPLRTLAL